VGEGGEGLGREGGVGEGHIINLDHDRYMGIAIELSRLPKVLSKLHSQDAVFELWKAGASTSSAA
jgi:hypothetical protein